MTRVDWLALAFVGLTALLGYKKGLISSALSVTGIFGVFPDLSFEARSQYIRDDLAVQEWTARGTHEGPMNRSGMTIEPTGRQVEYKGMDVIPIRDDLVARKDVYSDSITLLRQLGLTDIS